MLKLCDDLQNIIIAYLDLDNYYTLTNSYTKFSIARYENLYVCDLIKSVNSRILDVNITKNYKIAESCLVDTLKLFKFL